MDINLEYEMNPIEKMFSGKNKNILSIYFTAGYPRLNDTAEIIHALQKYGADMIEIGMPYSDPLADGPVIQHSSMRALQNGMTIPKLFEQLHHFQEETAAAAGNVPLILMGYLNPVLQFGFEKFCSEAKKAGISGIILPDLPVTEYENEYQEIFRAHDLSFIFLITPETSPQRIRKIDSVSTGFIYAVSSSSVTGKTTNMKEQERYFERIQNMNLKNKVLIGFGIRDNETFKQACKFAAGAIIGTAYIKAIGQTENIEASTRNFLHSIIQGSEAELPHE